MSAFWPRQEGDGLEPRGSFPLPQQSSRFSNEFQDAFGKDFRYMNMDELLRNIWTAEATQSMVSACGSAQGGAPSENVNLQQEGSLTLPRPTSLRTVDEVWKDVIKEYGGGGGSDKDGRCNSGSHLLQRQPSLGEMTLEDYLAKAEVVSEDARPENAVGIWGVGSTGEREMEGGLLNSGLLGIRRSKAKTLGGGRRNKRITGFRIAVTSEDSSQVQGLTVEETQAMASVCGSAQGGVPSENFNLQRQGSLTLPRSLSQRTVDEVWKDLTKESGGGGGGDKDGSGISGSHLHQRTHTFGEMALEDSDKENKKPNPVGIGGVGTGEREIEGGLLNSRCSGKRKRKEKTPGGGERGNKKTTGVRIPINLEDISEVQGMTVEHAARHLNVSRSTFKRACREHGIERWPPRKGHKLSSQSPPNESPVVIDQELISQLNSDMLLPSNQVSATRNTNTVTVKARYGKETIKFRLSWPWRTAELKQQVEKRLEHKDGTYFIRYKDEANEMILIACDEDLQDCISSSSPQDTSLIEVFLEPKSLKNFALTNFNSATLIACDEDLLEYKPSSRPISRHQFD